MNDAQTPTKTRKKPTDAGFRKVKVHGVERWQARVAFAGLRKSALCDSRDVARAKAGDLLRELKDEAKRAAVEGQRPATLKTLLDFYVADLQDRGKDPARAIQTAKVIEATLPALLARPVTTIGDADVFAFRNLRAREGKTIVETVDGEKRTRKVPNKPATINRDLRVVRAALKKARPEYRFPAGAFFPEDETRVRWLRPEEELLVFDPMASPYREMAQLAALTLMRLSEIRLLRREQVRLEQGVTMLPRAKGGARAVILSASAQKLLQRQLEAVAAAVDADQPEEKRAIARRALAWVFPNPETGEPFDRNTVGRKWRKAARAAGLRDFTFHDLRHHGATMALNKGFTAAIVQSLGGWKTERMMRRYAAVTDTTLRAAAEAVSGNEPWQQLSPRAESPAMAAASA